MDNEHLPDDPNWSWQKAMTAFTAVLGTGTFGVYALNRIPRSVRGPHRFLFTAAAIAPTAAYAAYEAGWQTKSDQ